MACRCWPLLLLVMTSRQQMSEVTWVRLLALNRHWRQALLGRLQQMCLQGTMQCGIARRSARSLLLVQGT
jgi:hypothetical protein